MRVEVAVYDVHVGRLVRSQTVPERQHRNDECREADQDEQEVPCLEPVSRKFTDRAAWAVFLRCGGILNLSAEVEQSAKVECSLRYVFQEQQRESQPVEAIIIGLVCVQTHTFDLLGIICDRYQCQVEKRVNRSWPDIFLAHFLEVELGELMDPVRDL